LLPVNKNEIGFVIMVKTIVSVELVPLVVWTRRSPVIVVAPPEIVKGVPLCLFKTIFPPVPLVIDFEFALAAVNVPQLSVYPFRSSSPLVRVTTFVVFAIEKLLSSR
jgi:hypothetical protein